MYIIRKSFGPFSSGTRVVDMAEETDSTTPEMRTVRLVTKPSEALLSQKHPLIQEMGKSGIFKIPTNLLVERRNRVVRFGVLSEKRILSLIAGEK